MTVMSPPPPRSLWDRLNSSTLLRFLLLFASGWAVIQTLAYFEIVVVVFVSATIFAFLLSHPVRWCRRLMPHSLAVVTVFGVSLLMLSGLVLTVSLAVLSQGPQLIASIAEFLNSLGPLITRAEAVLQQRGLEVDLQTLNEQAREQALILLGAGFGLLQALLSNFIIT
ncbi:MAG: AI-2E family transporter, partial [Leptolyngbya sp. SIO4C1]|nr:AI-2E family transporter [Leptolyngbya sp. SIO4C1]